MKQFNLEEYLKDPSRKVVTRDGRKVTRFLCTDAQTEFPIIALVEAVPGSTKECLRTFTKNGTWSMEENSPCDLFFLPNKKEGWINIYNNNNHSKHIIGSLTIYDSEKDAKNAKDGIEGGINYITTIKIEWEE